MSVCIYLTLCERIFMAVVNVCVCLCVYFGITYAN